MIQPSLNYQVPILRRRSASWIPCTTWASPSLTGAGAAPGDSSRQLAKLAEVNRLGVEGKWEFDEWCHGRTGRPMGYPHQAWSAGMYIFAHCCVAEERVMLL